MLNNHVQRIPALWAMNIEHLSLFSLVIDLIGQRHPAPQKLRERKLLKNTKNDFTSVLCERMKQSYLDEKKIDLSTDMISRYDRQLLVTGWNPACEKKFNIQASDAMNKSLIELFPRFDMKNDFRYRCLIDAAQDGKSFFFPALPYKYYEGTYYQFISPLKYEDGSLAGVINIVRDSAFVHTTITKKDLIQPIISTSLSNVKHLLE